MTFKRGFLRRPDAFSNTNGHENRMKQRLLYYIPDFYSTEVSKGPDASPQKFAGTYENPRVEYRRQNPYDSLNSFHPSTIQGMGPHILLNLDLGSNAMNGEDGREKIPMWITVDQIDMLNDLVGPPPPEGIKAADKTGKKWGRIMPGPDLGGPRRDGEGVIWEIRKIEGKGDGVFALRDLEIGELVINERPIQILPTEFPMAARDEKVVNRIDWYTFPHERRSPSQKARFESLCNSKILAKVGNHEDISGTVASTLYEGITRTNRIGFAYLDDPSHHYTAVYGAISRLNNSCGANVAWKFNMRTFSKEIRAVCKVKAGEELTASYADELNTIATRREWLSQRYQFTCNCAWCSLQGDEAIQSDKRRTELGKWHGTRLTFDAWKSGMKGSRKQLIEDTVEHVETLREEGLDCYLRLIYLDLAQAYTAFCDKEQAIKYALLALETLGDSYETRGWHERLAEIQLMADSPEKHPNWGYSFHWETT